MENKNTVYLASGWFSEEQKRKMDEVRNLLLDMNFEVFAPFYDGVVLDSKNDSLENRKSIFESNVTCIKNFDLVVAIIDEYDPGTVFEIGYAKCSYDIGGILGKPKIISYSDIPGRTLNVMLAQSCWGFANGIEQLKEQLARFRIGIEPKDFLVFEKGNIQ